MKYVTFDVAGVLTGAYRQALHPAHVGVAIEVTEDEFTRWTRYRANDQRDGVELMPAVDPVTPVPSEITMRQARLALLGAGLLANVNATINALPSPQKEAAQIEWEYSNSVQRHNGFVSQLGPLLGMTAAQIDTLFISAQYL